MEVLLIENIEKRNQDQLLFPLFSLQVSENNVTAIYSSVNIRNVLLEMFTGKTSLVMGDIVVNGERVSRNKKVYFSKVGFCFLNDGLYERLTVLDHLKLYRDLYHSNESIEQSLHLTQLEAKKIKK